MNAGNLVALGVGLAKSDDLRRPRWRGHPNPVAGHCYIACEVLAYLSNGTLKPYVVRIDERTTHWYLRDRNGQIVDPTATQFAQGTVPYDRGRRCGFLTKSLSKRARALLGRMLNSFDPLPDWAKEE